MLDHSKVNIRTISWIQAPLKIERQEDSHTEPLKMYNTFCLTKTSVAQMSIWNTECFRLSLRRCAGWWLSVDLAPEEVNPTP